MAQASVAQIIRTQNQTEATPANKADKSQGKLVTESGSYSFSQILEGSSFSKWANEFLQEMNLLPEDLAEILEQHTFFYFSAETIDVETQILNFLKFLETLSPPKEDSKNPTSQSKLETPNNPLPLSSKTQENTKSSVPFSKSTQAPTYSSVFSLARAINQNLNAAKKETHENKNERGERPSLNGQISIPEKQTQVETRFEKDQNRERQDQEGKEKRQGQGSSDEEKKRRQNQAKEEYKRKIKGTSAVRSANERHVQTSYSSSAGGSAGTGVVHSIENIYIRFMALMARILGQAEAEAHELYLRIKERTDSVDVLTLFLSKINSEKGTIDWTKNEEMKKLVEQVRAIGVDIPQGKYKWSEEEKKLLKENVQMRKDSMEKVTQLERTDMQRYLQEASQCHQARSNVLKLLKEVMDTIIANMRP